MAHNQIKLSKTASFTALVLVGIILLLAPQSITNKLNFAFVRIFKHVLNIGPAASAHNSADAEQFVPRQMHNLLQIAYNNLLADLIEEHRRLEELAGLRSELPSPGTNLVLANVMRSGKDELIVNRGKSSGLVKGQYVLGMNCVIGTVADVSVDYASVRLITHPALSIHAVIRTEPDNTYVDEGLLKGTGGEVGRMRVAREYEIKVGFVVYAAKRAGLLETPRVIGTIQSCQIDEEYPLLWDIIVAPAADLSALSDVAVIVMQGKKKK